MMKTFRLLLLPLAAILVCVSCGHKQPTSIPESEATTEFKPEFPIHIQLSGSEEYKNTLTLSDMVADIQYIPLETTRECLLGPSALYQLTHDYIFVQTRGVTFLFDRQGKFIRRINRQGKGPEECSGTSYCIDEKGQFIYIYDIMKRGIYTYTFEGEFVKVLRNPFAGVPDGQAPSFIDFDGAKGNLLFSFENNHGDMKYKYVVSDTSGTILYKCPNYTLNHMKNRNLHLSFSQISPLYKCDSYYYEDRFNDTIFIVNDDYTCSPAYIRSVPNRYTLKDDMEVAARMKKLADFSGKNSYSRSREDERYLYLYHSQQLSSGYVFMLSLYDKAAGTLMENINATPVNNWDGGMDMELHAEVQNGNQFVFPQFPFYLKETLTTEHFASRDIAHPEKAEALKQLVSTLKEDDNPVLMIITMK